MNVVRQKLVSCFLSAIANRSLSYVLDRFYFIFKINKLSERKNDFHDCFLITMDVSSLYPNIDHEEGTEASNKSF